MMDQISLRTVLTIEICLSLSYPIPLPFPFTVQKFDFFPKLPTSVISENKGRQEFFLIVDLRWSMVDGRFDSFENRKSTIDHRQSWKHLSARCVPSFSSSPRNQQPIRSTRTGFCCRLCGNCVYFFFLNTSCGGATLGSGLSISPFPACPRESGDRGTTTKKSKGKLNKRKT